MLNESSCYNTVYLEIFAQYILLRIKRSAYFTWKYYVSENMDHKKTNRITCQVRKKSTTRNCLLRREAQTISTVKIPTFNRKNISVLMSWKILPALLHHARHAAKQISLELRIFLCFSTGIHRHRGGSSQSVSINQFFYVCPLMVIHLLDISHIIITP